MDYKPSLGQKELMMKFIKDVNNAQQSRIMRIIKHPYKMAFPKLLSAAKKNKRMKAKTFWGGDMDILLPEVVSTYIWRYGFFESDVCFYMLNLLKEGMTFIDIGGHFGFFSLLASYLVEKEGKVLTFEPTPSTYSQLQKNVVSFSQYPNIETYNLAAYSENKEIKFNDYGLEYSAFNSAFGLRDHSTELEKREILVKTIKVDDAITQKEIKSVDLLKIDAESAEMPVLRGMTETLKQFRPSVIIELGDFGIKGVPSSKEIIEWLQEIGFSPYEVYDGKIVPHAIKNNYIFSNLLFMTK